MRPWESVPATREGGGAEGGGAESGDRKDQLVHGLPGRAAVPDINRALTFAR